MLYHSLASFPGSGLHSDCLRQCNKDLFLMVVLELSIHCILMQVLDLVASTEITLLDFLEVPSDKIFSSRCDNA